MTLVRSLGCPECRKSRNPPLEVACPQCEAPPARRCVARLGRRMVAGAVHAGRTRAAIAAGFTRKCTCPVKT